MNSSPALDSESTVMTRNITADGATPLNPADRGHTPWKAMRFFTIAEVAEIVGVPEATVKTRMFYARKRLSQLVEAA